MPSWADEPVFTPPAEGYDDVVVRARRRRNRRKAKLALTSLPLAAVAAVAVLVVPGGGGATNGFVIDPPRVTRSPVPVETTGKADDTTDPSTGPTGAAAESAGGSNGTAEVAGPVASRTAAPAGGSRPLAAPSPRAHVSPNRPSVQADYDYLTNWAPADCLAQAAERDRSEPTSESRRWCEAYSGHAEVVAGEENALSFDVCRAAGMGTGTLTSPDARMLALTITDTDGALVWRWGGRTPPGTKVRVDEGDCARWTLPWVAVDAAGRPFDPGTQLVLEPAFGAAEFPGWSLPYTVTVVAE